METKTLAPILVPANHILGWIFAHEDLIAHTTHYGEWGFIMLHSGHQLYGRSGESDTDHWTDPEEQTPQMFAEWFAGDDDWVAAIRDIPELAVYHTYLLNFN